MKKDFKYDAKEAIKKYNEKRKELKKKKNRV